MREVGVILDVTPTYSEANGGTIDLELKPQVVDEPTWKNYGMKIPFTGNSSLESFEGIGSIFEGLASALDAIQAPLKDADRNAMAMSASDAANSALANLSKSSSDTMTYYDAPMEQPFFHVRSIDSKVSITPGSTVVMGGLITEARKAMDDKVPFLGDIPYIGRFFRSHSEWTSKRNLLIFVTGRLITPSGRELRTENPDVNPADVTPAPKAE
jgi:type II secretory pathway component GspD/PulD (secretin)